MQRELGEDEAAGLVYTGTWSGERPLDGEGTYLDPAEGARYTGTLSDGRPFTGAGDWVYRDWDGDGIEDDLGAAEIGAIKRANRYKYGAAQEPAGEEERPTTVEAKEEQGKQELRDAMSSPMREALGLKKLDDGSVTVSGHWWCGDRLVGSEVEEIFTGQLKPKVAAEHGFDVTVQAPPLVITLTPGVSSGEFTKLELLVSSKEQPTLSSFMYRKECTPRPGEATTLTLDEAKANEGRRWYISILGMCEQTRGGGTVYDFLEYSLRVRTGEWTGDEPRNNRGVFEAPLPHCTAFGGRLRFEGQLLSGLPFAGKGAFLRKGHAPTAAGAAAVARSKEARARQHAIKTETKGRLSAAKAHGRGHTMAR